MQNARTMVPGRRRQRLLRTWLAGFLLPLAAALLCSILLIPTAAGSEIDNITTHRMPLDDALAILNATLNQRIAEGVENANRKSGDEYCDEETLYTELRKSIFQSLTASIGLKGYALDKQLRDLLQPYSFSLSLDDSIYRDLNYLEAFSLNLKELTDLVNADGHLIGLDKIGHFFAEGWGYFELTTSESQSLEQAMGWGGELESGLFGYTTTGIHSYADLTANFNGWIFWNKVLAKQPHPLKGPIGNLFNRPYVRCSVRPLKSIKALRVVREWRYNNTFDLSDYIDGAWDEGNNCNSYKNPVIEEKVKSRISELAPQLECPLSAADCRAAVKKYDAYAGLLLHPACLLADD